MRAIPYRICHFAVIASLLGWSGVGPLQADDAVDADLLLVGGLLVDGTGAPPRHGDLAVRGTQIVAVGTFDVGRVGKQIDCRGLIVSPGFIDLHNHSDTSILKPATCQAANYLTQGCTTIVTGNCGGGHVDVGRFYRRLEKRGCGPNVAHLLPHGSLREEVLGSVRRAPSTDELEQMRQLTEQAMQEGAWGMSTGLQYVPGSFADIDELAALAAVVAQYGGIYASHIRDEGDQLLESIDEAISIGRRSGINVHVSHFKASKQSNWGKVRAAAQLIKDARADGLRVTADQYPYNASSTTILAMLLPDAEREGGEDATLARLSDPAQLPRLRQLMDEALQARGKILIASCPGHQEWVGRTIRQVAEASGRMPVDVAIDVVQAGAAQGVSFSMDERDVRYVMTLPWVATASDGSSKIDDGTSPHPRSFGTFPRKIGFYGIDQQVIPVEHAVRSATGLPADILGFEDRGYLRVGAVADVAVCDPKILADRATFQEPFLVSTGVRWVLVGGRPVVVDGRPQDELAGQPLRKR